MTDKLNAKNKLAELLKSIGHQDNELTEYKPISSFSNPNKHFSNLVVTFPHDLILRGIGMADRKKEAEVIAAQQVLDKLDKYHPELIVDWDNLMVEAQRGDVLIKLGIYLSDDFQKTSDKSLELQRTETNVHLAKVYDQWIADKDPDLAGWGTHMDVHNKASVVETLIWRRFNKNVLVEGANEHLKTLIKSINF